MREAADDFSNIREPEDIVVVTESFEDDEGRMEKRMDAKGVLVTDSTFLRALSADYVCVLKPLPSLAMRNWALASTLTKRFMNLKF